MAHIRLAASDGWKRKTQTASPPPTFGKVRLTDVFALDTGGTDPPPNPTSTFIGYNSMALAEGDYFAAQFGKTPMARIYPGDLNTDGTTWWNPGGTAYKGANLGMAGHVSGKRLNVSWTAWDPRQVTGATSALALKAKAFAASVPAGWYVQVVLYHEWNLHTRDGMGSGNPTGPSVAEYLAAFPILAQAILAGDNGRGRCIPVINPAYETSTSWQDSCCPKAADMPVGTELHFDVYNNPIGQPTGYTAYGTTYRTGLQIFTPMYAAVGRLGYLAPGYGWGIDEHGAPRRVGLTLPTLTNGWGPLTPQDDDGTQMAKVLGDFFTACLNAPVKPTTLIFFTGIGNWNQLVQTAGTANKDQAGANHRGFPMNVDPTKVMAAYKAIMAQSA